MNDNTTTSINTPTFSTGGTTESNDSIEIKNKSLLAEKASTILKVITYFFGIIITFMIATVLTNLIWPENSKQVYKDAFDKGYNQGYNNAKSEASKPDQTIDFSKSFQYESKK